MRWSEYPVMPRTCVPTDWLTMHRLQSICMVPVLGGVVEYGTSDGPCTATWESYEDCGGDGLPKAELNKAFRGGATCGDAKPPCHAALPYRARPPHRATLLATLQAGPRCHPVPCSPPRYAIFWKPEYSLGKYRMAGHFETDAQALSQDKCSSLSYVAQCKTFSPNIGGSGPIGAASC